MNLRNKLLIAFNTIFIGIFAAGCQTLPRGCGSDGQTIIPPLNSEVENLNARLGSGLYLQKINNLIVIVDDTASMMDCYDNHPKRERAANITDRLARTIPDIELEKGIRVYGPFVNENANDISLTHGAGLSPSNKLREKVLTKTVIDTTFNPLANALEGAYHELKLVEGTSAIVVISDFKDPMKEMAFSANLIKDYYKGDVCVYPIVIGEDGPGRNSAEDMVGITGCGIAAMADSLESGPALADYVEKIIFDKQQPIVEPEVARPGLSYEKLMKEGKLTIELKTEFDFDKSKVKAEYYDHLKEISAFMKKHPNIVTTIEGHTCSIGTEEYNLGLSRRRAESVKQHLVDLGINELRLNIAAYGETRPIADNSTLEGRRKNRRAVAVITATVQEYNDQQK